MNTSIDTISMGQPAKHYSKHYECKVDRLCDHIANNTKEFNSNKCAQNKVFLIYLMLISYSQQSSNVKQ